jgi:hypothetical protein
MRWKSIIALMAVIIVIIPCNALPKTRQGLVSEMSIGLAPLSKFSSRDVTENGTGFVFDFSGGYGWNDQNIIALIFEFSWRNSDYYTALGHTYGTHWDGTPYGDQIMRQDFIGPVWYHYFRPEISSIYSAAGIGFYDFNKSDFGKNDRGTGWLIGGGFQPAKYCQLGTYFIGGKTNSGSDHFKHIQLSVMLSVIIQSSHLWFMREN